MKLVKFKKRGKVTLSLLRKRDVFFNIYDVFTGFF
jgi:hypothetical protein